MRMLLVAAVACPLLAQSPSPSIKGAQLGYLFDAKTVWSVSGVPGAAALDANLGFAVESAFVHSRARLAVANVKGGAVALLRWNGETSLTPVASSLSRVSIVAFSRSGEYAAVSDGAAVELWSGLRSSAVTPSAFTADLAGNAISALAVNDAGLVATASELGVALLSKENSRRLAAGEWTALSFSPAGNELAGADASTGRLQVFRDLSGDSAPGLVSDDLGRIGALAYSSTGDRIAAAGARSIAIFDLAASTRQNLDCDWRVSGFESLTGDLVLLLKGTGTPTLLDADSSPARFAPIPPLMVQTVAGRNAQ